MSETSARANKVENAKAESLRLCVRSCGGTDQDTSLATHHTTLGVPKNN